MVEVLLVALAPIWHAHRWSTLGEATTGVYGALLRVAAAE